MASSDEAAAAAGGTVVASRVSIWESLKGCGIFHKEIAKEELRHKVVMPKYLRVAMRTASMTKDVTAAVAAASSAVVGDEEPMVAPEAPLVVFVNSKSGGRHGPELKERLHELISIEQVRNISLFCIHYLIYLLVRVSLSFFFYLEFII
jgi:diacylglycerol kinase (ATP)